MDRARPDPRPDDVGGRGRVRERAAASLSREDVEVLLEVPLTDRADKALPLVSLVVEKDVQHFARERCAYDGVGLQGVESFSERRGDARHLLAGFDGFINVAVFGRSRI